MTKSSTKLSASSLASFSARGIRTPHYALGDAAIGVVHFGPGAFHRVHQAFYFDELLVHDKRWGICEVALQSSSVRDALAPQDGLYTLAVLDSEPSMRIIGSARKLLVARESHDAVLKQLINPSTHIISATITEKGYHLTARGDLDVNHADVQHDLSHPHSPITFIGYVAESLRQRRTLGLSAPIIISCDNLTDNGQRLRRAVIQFIECVNKSSSTWVANEVAFPRTMVDSITPATDDALRERVRAQLGVDDAWPVQREAFTQWVIEEHSGTAPDWPSVGVTITNDVSGYERAKLRLLNGAHSTLAYIGSLAGINTVSQAMSQPHLEKFVRTLMQIDITPNVVAPQSLNVPEYINSLLQRFKNPMLPHRLAQIAWDGSQKIPFRLLGTIGDALAADKPIERLCMPIAAWFHFIRRKARANELAIDPLAKQLFDIGIKCTGDAQSDVKLFLSMPQIFSSALAANIDFIRSIAEAYARLEQVRSADDLPNALELSFRHPRERGDPS